VEGGWSWDGAVLFVAVGGDRAAALAVGTRVGSSWRASVRATWMVCIVQLQHQMSAEIGVVIYDLKAGDHEWESLPWSWERPVGVVFVACDLCKL